MRYIEGLGVNAMYDSNDKMIETADRIGRLHNEFDELVSVATEGAREYALDNGGIDANGLIAQMMMDSGLFPSFVDPDLAGGSPDTVMTPTQKANLVHIAAHMGPDWCQALYHAAVFMTKVA